METFDPESLGTSTRRPYGNGKDYNDVFAQSFKKYNSSSKFITAIATAHNSQSAGLDFLTLDPTLHSSTGLPNPTYDDYATSAKDFSPSQSESSLGIPQKTSISAITGVYKTGDLDSSFFDDVLEREYANDYTAFQNAIEHRVKCAREAAHQTSSQISEPEFTFYSRLQLPASKMAIPTPTSLNQTTPLLASAPEPPKTMIPPPLPPPPSRVNEPRKRTRKRRIISLGEAEIRRSTFLERNRQAASKCRIKKKDWVGQLEKDVETKQEMNFKLIVERKDLMQDVKMLKDLVAQCSMEDKRQVLNAAGLDLPSNDIMHSALFS